MTKSTITRERLEQLADNNTICKVSWDERIELAQIALAAMDSDPVALQPELAKVIYHFRDWNEGFPVERFKADYVISWMLANYPPAQPAKDREQVRREHAEWSQATFGNVGPVDPLKHLSKEALEAAAEPGDLSEWADMQFLLWDAQRRAGITDEQITQAMIEKLAVNKQREWPEPKDGEPRLHIKAQSAPVVPDDVLEALQKVARIRLDMNDFDGDRRGIADCLCDAEEALIEVVNRRAATLAAASQEVSGE
ncbi:Eaa1 [Klebsiella quasivariicola]|nr:Eaa1 [Klebsiella quasivariicola]